MYIPPQGKYFIMFGHPIPSQNGLIKTFVLE